MFLTVIVSHLWAIACFAIHLWFSSPKSRDLLHHQRQAVLRNNGGPLNTAWILIQIIWIWRRLGAIRRIGPLVTFTLLLSSALAVATAFSARIAIGNEVLLTGDSKDSNILIDSGPIDSHSDLGLNAPQDERFSFRVVLHCAPLVTEGYRSTLNISSDRSFARYFYGEPLLSFRPSEYTPANVTYEYPDDFVTRINITGLNYAWSDYTLSALLAYVTNGTTVTDGYSDFKPITDLQRHDADTTLMFLSTNSVGFVQNTADIWYNASQSTPPEEVSPGELSDPTFVPWSHQSEPASPLACARQEQYCTSGGGNCTPLSSSHDAKLAAKSLFRDTDQYQRWKWITTATKQITADEVYVIGALRSQALASRFNFLGGVQGAIPDNQWQLDVQYWHAVQLATMQKAVVDVAIGPLADEEAEIMLEWGINSTLQLQRLAHEELGIQPWSRCDGPIPCLESSARLARLDISDAKHPKFIAETLIPEKSYTDAASLSSQPAHQTSTKESFRESSPTASLSQRKESDGDIMSM
ncbi:hypothetical protein JX265_006725 [Neoarthrinium moseri]|uniref:Uncharacterized protein n=1 Tax=Neoarthrinium moseri TaxID=1658444 RepID=A0A9P9WL71_9PEZI|nr:hypothetical protein JX265_006725 [Neoarthrinium moseri]